MNKEKITITKIRKKKSKGFRFLPPINIGIGPISIIPPLFTSAFFNPSTEKTKANPIRTMINPNNIYKKLNIKSIYCLLIFRDSEVESLMFKHLHLAVEKSFSLLLMLWIIKYRLPAFK